MTRGQLRMGFDGPTAIDQLAVHKNMELYQIKNRVVCLEKVITMSQYYIGKLRETNGD